MSLSRDSSGYTRMSDLIALSLFFLSWSLVHAGYLCHPFSPNPKDPQVPKINGSFVAFLEWWEMRTQTVTFREEYVDQETNIAAVRIHGRYDPGDVYTYISDYNSSQLYVIGETSQGRTCKVSTIDPRDTYSFKFVLANNTEHIVSTPALLNYGNNAYFEFDGDKHEVRGKKSNMWQACIKDDTFNETMLVEIYFSEESWITSTSSHPVPLQSTITRLIPSGPSSVDDYEIKVRIDYLLFQNYITDKSIFQLPTGLLCEGRKPLKPVPKIPGHFRFRSEFIITHTNEVGEYDEWYNQDEKIVRIDSKPMPGDMAVLDLSTRTQILDFNMGISYLIIQDTGTCAVTPIMPEVFNVKLVDASHVAMKSPMEMFHFESGNFTYSGMTKVRGISTDVWTGQLTDYPLGVNSTSIWSWYFSTDEWSVTQFGEPQKNVPLLLTIDLPQKGLHYLYSIYDFSPKDPDLVDFDVSACYLENDLRHLQFSLIGNSQTAAKEPSALRYQLAQQLTNIMDVSILRISRLQVDFYHGGLSAEFTLLDPPDFIGDVTGEQNPKAQTPSQTAVQNLDSFLQEGTIFLHFRVQNVNKNMVSNFVSDPSSLQEVVRYLNGSVQQISHAKPTSMTHTQKGETTTAGENLPAQSSFKTPSSSQEITSDQTSPSSTLQTEATKRSDTDISKSDNAISSTRNTPNKASSKSQCTKCQQTSSSDSTWTSSKVAGLAVGVLFCGIVVGVLTAILGQQLPCIKAARKRHQSEFGNQAYSMM